MSIIFSIFLPVTTIAYDDKAKWNAYALTMPVSSTQLVLSKYILGYSGILISSIIFFVISNFVPSGMPVTNLQLFGIIVCIGVTILSIYLSIIFKFGAEKSRYIILLLFAIPTLLVLLFSKTGMKAPSADLVDKIIAFAPVVVVFIAIVCIMISITTMQKKEY